MAKFSITPLSSLGGHKKGATGKDPLLGVGVFTLHLEASGKHVGWATHRRHVDWALVHANSDEFSSSHGSHVHNWQFRMEFLKDHLSEVTLFTATTSFPSGTLKAEPINISSTSSKLSQISHIFGIQNSSLQLHLIKGKQVGTGSDLLNGRQVT